MPSYSLFIKNLEWLRVPGLNVLQGSQATCCCPGLVWWRLLPCQWAGILPGLRLRLPAVVHFYSAATLSVPVLRTNCQLSMVRLGYKSARCCCWSLDGRGWEARALQRQCCPGQSGSNRILRLQGPWPTISGSTGKGSRPSECHQQHWQGVLPMHRSRTSGWSGSMGLRQWPVAITYDYICHMISYIRGYEIMYYLSIWYHSGKSMK